MDWGLLAGGVSKGINDAFSGANQGLVQGEGIRAGRAAEALQGQHLGLQTQTLQSHLAQQQVQNQLARDQLGLHRDQLQQQLAYHNSILGIHGGDLAVKQALVPSQIAQHTAQANAYNSLPEYRANIAGERSRTNDIRSEGNEIRRQHWDNLHNDALARLAYLGRSLEQRARTFPLTPQDRADYQSLHTLRQQLGQTARFMDLNPGMPLPKGFTPMPDMLGQIKAIEEGLQARARVANPPVGVQGGMPGGDDAAIRRKYGLPPSTAPQTLEDAQRSLFGVPR